MKKMSAEPESRGSVSTSSAPRGSTSTAPSGLIIRSFRIEDYDPVVSLWKRSRLPYKPSGRDARKRIARELEGSSAVFLVAELKGKLVGSVFATHDGRKGWINRLAVAPSCRRQGIAARLVEEAERRLAGQGIEIVACLIEDWNADSKRFFQSIGYQRFDEISYFTKRKHPDV
jgi:ribosomal protein S18 acetylase RimI-like enzyme